MAQKKGIIFGVVAAVVVLIAVVAVVGLTIVNNRAETEMTRNVDETLRAAGMAETVTYDSIDVQSGRGTVRIEGLRMEDPSQPTRIRADSVSLRIPPTEALALVRNPESAEISNAKLTVSGMEMDVPETAMALSMNTANMEISGRLSQELAGGNPMVLLQQLDAIDFSADGIAFEPGPAMLAQLQMQGGATWLADEDNRRIEEINLASTISPEQIEITNLDFTAPFLTASGSSSIGINQMMQPIPEAMDYRVEEIAPELRQQFTMVASMMGMTVPAEGPFSFTYRLDETGNPEFTIE
ncbi:MAG: hypothetical protein PF508_19190 [Spirochaeta sp.]|jgi:hypothetical protein|nr:hypothetical protein [Spirochaeta sp.]